VIDLDRAALDRLLPASPGAPDWADVLSRARVRESTRRRRLLVLAFAALIVVIGTASAFATVRDVFLDRGFIGLPPEGAPSSTETAAELVLHYFGPGPEGSHGKRRVWVYDDGRVVWLQDGGFPVGANPASTGFLQQWLTPEGVELVRSEAVSSGTFGDEPPPAAFPPGPPCPKGVSPGVDGCVPRTPPPAPDQPVVVPFYIQVQVSDVGRLVRVDRARRLDELVARLADLASWLPASAWLNQDVRAYVPSHYAVCYGAWPPDRPIEQSLILSLVPDRARQLLSGGDALPNKGLFGSPGRFRPVTDHCVRMSTEEARAVFEALEAAGLERFMRRYRLAFRSAVPGGKDEAVHVYFEPYLPHGDITCSACG
jgi:hypothetical protein